jgi:hypothetical protein
VPAPSFKYYQALELAQSRAMKRYSTALRQIERSRKGLGAEAQAISYDFLVEPPIPERFLDAETEDGGCEPAAAPALVPSDGVAQSDPVVDPADVTQDAAADRIWEILQAVAAGTSPNEAADAVPPVAEAAPTRPSSGEEVAQTVPSVAFPDRAVEAVRSRITTGEAGIDKNLSTGPVNFVAWLTGAERYKWLALQQAAQKEFNKSFMSIRSLVRALVVDRKIVRPDRVCLELAQYLPPVAEAAPTRPFSGEKIAQTTPSLASPGEAVEPERPRVLGGEAAIDKSGRTSPSLARGPSDIPGSTCSKQKRSG